MSETEVMHGGIGLSDETGSNGSALTTAEGAAMESPINTEALKQMGFITPLASPQDLRAAFAYQQKMMAAILDENDYIYLVSWDDGQKRKQRLETVREAAERAFEKVKTLNGQMSAKPKKSGIVKLARALGITATRKRSEGLPEDWKATYSYVEYEAFHEGTGKRETGVGACDNTEKGGRISKHDIITTADTRAYNRAILRLAGFGDVSADELVAGASEGAAEILVDVPRAAKTKKLEPIPAEDDDDVIAAARSWAEAVARRAMDGDDGYWEPEGKQDTRAARELRAQARRGHARAAHQLGSKGLYWKGTASDGLGYPTFTVYEPPVMPADIEATWDAADKAKEQVDETVGKKSKKLKPKKGEKGWNLSGKGSDKDDEGLPPDIAESQDKKTKATGIPTPAPNADPITMGQAKKVSKLLKAIYSDVSDMKAWLKDNAHVEKSTLIHANQYEPVMKALKALKKENENNG